MSSRQRQNLWLAGSAWAMLGCGKCVVLAGQYPFELHEERHAQPYSRRFRDLKEIADELAPIAASREELIKDPMNPGASLVDGKFRCFVRQDWERGLKLLAQSRHAALAAAAQKDLVGASNHEGEAEIAEAWFDLGIDDVGLLGALIRAKHWFQLATKTAPPMERVRYERRVALIDSKLPPEMQEPPEIAPLELASARELLTGVRTAD